MELDDLRNSTDSTLASLYAELGKTSDDASKIVETFDREWYVRVVGRARKMDLIGDFAGTERFVVDGAFDKRSFA